MARTALLSNRWSNSVAIGLQCLTAGSIFVFPLWSPPFSRNLGLTMQQTTLLASASIFGEYASAVGWGWLADRRGPGSVSWAAAVLFGVGYGMMGWRYNISVEMEREGLDLPPLQWLWLAGYYFLSGCATAASYFASIITASKSYPARHSGLAIGVPCAIFGLSPLFLSSLATYFTSSDTASSAVLGVAGGELDPGRWLLFLAVLLFVVNGIGGCVLQVIPWEEDHGAVGKRGDDSGFVGNGAVSVASNAVVPTEQTALLPTVRPSDPPPSPPSEPLSVLLRNPTFWLFGLVIFLAIGPCEMVMASLGGIVESLLGFHILPTSVTTAVDPSRALRLRRLHVQIISVANTLSRLLAGGISDWLSYSASPSPAPSRSPSPTPSITSHRTGRSRSNSLSASLKTYFHTPPRLSRLVFLAGAAFLLALAFAYTAFALDYPAGLWVLSVSVGVGYGTLFTLAPAIVRTVWPVADFGRNFGLVNWFSAAGALLFTPLYGVLSDVASGRQGAEQGVCYGRACWRDVFLVSAGSAAVAGLLAGGLWRGWWRGLV